MPDWNYLDWKYPRCPKWLEPILIGLMFFMIVGCFVLGTFFIIAYILFVLNLVPT